MSTLGPRRFSQKRAQNTLLHYFLPPMYINTFYVFQNFWVDVKEIISKAETLYYVLLK